jgi:hypothetical protein
MNRSVGHVLRLVITMAATASALTAQRGRIALESFDGTSGWTASPSDGVRLSLRADSGGALRMDIDYQGHAGYAVARHAFTLSALPSYWAVTLRVRGVIPPNTLELKFVDSSGLNVWWMRKPDLHVTPSWTELRFRPSDLSFAWGPLGGGPPHGIASLEIAFTAGQGGRGWLSLDDLTLIPLDPPVATGKLPRVTTSLPASGERLIGTGFNRAPLFGEPAPPIAWRAPVGRQTISLDFGGVRDLSGIALQWGDAWARDLDVQTSDDGSRWTTVREVRDAAGGTRFIHLPGTETGHLRLVLLRAAIASGYALRSIHVLSDSAALSASDFLARVAAASTPGTWPRAYTGQQSYWTVFGLPRDARDGLMSEDGAIDTGPGKFSIEPFLFDGDTLLTWRDGTTAHALDGRVRPIPIVSRTARALRLDVSAFASGSPGSATFWVRYHVVNLAARSRDARLVAELRPVQVNPPWQFLGVPGGAASVRSMSWNGDRLVVNDSDAVVSLPSPASVALSPFAGGTALERLHDAASTARSISDPTGFASAALEWRIALRANDSTDVWIALPNDVRGSPSSSGSAALVAAREQWDRELATTRVSFPGSGSALAATLSTALGDILVNAHGPAIQPGTRSYRRSWIRDGALTSSALLRMGHAADVKAFLEWFTPFVFADGKVPCCVDARGADPVTENDADGELLFLAAEYWRKTGDTAAARRLWPRLSRTAAHLDSLRNSRRAAQYRTPDSLLVFGLLPPSISHEGYSAKPAYSLWDDFWGVRGMADAALLARLANDASAVARYSSASREFRDDVVAAIGRSMRLHHMHEIPGAVELGDIDPTSTTVALEPGQLAGVLPDSSLRATFDRAWRSFLERRDRNDWDVFTPYEWRVVGSYIRLGEPDRAHALAGWLMTMRRPAEWNQWSEAVWRDARAPKFVGDIPHTWVASDFIRATLDFVEYEREADSTLIVGAGIPYQWAADRAGVSATGLHTTWGVFSYRAERSKDGIRVSLGGARPPRGFEVHAPFGKQVRDAIVDGHPVAVGKLGAVRVPAGAGPISILFRYQ